jgi:hypothetical protein
LELIDECHVRTLRRGWPDVSRTHDRCCVPAVTRQVRAARRQIRDAPGQIGPALRDGTVTGMTIRSPRAAIFQPADAVT